MSGIRLTDVEKTMVSRIVAYGDGHGYSDEEIKIAVKVAYIESSLGSDMEKNQTSTAKGLYQYTDPTWQDRHAQLGDKNVADHQITAFFVDLAQDKISYQSLPPDVKEKLRFDEYVYIGHKEGVNFVNQNDLYGVLNNKAITIWDSGKKAHSFDPAWIDEARSHHPATSELPDQFLNQIEPQTVMDVIESGVAGGLAMEVIAEQLADLYLPQSAVLPAGEADTTVAQATTTMVDRQTLIDAWNHLLRDAG